MDWAKLAQLSLSVSGGVSAICFLLMLFFRSRERRQESLTESVGQQYRLDGDALPKVLSQFKTDKVKLEALKHSLELDESQLEALLSKMNSVDEAIHKRYAHHLRVLLSVSALVSFLGVLVAVISLNMPHAATSDQIQHRTESTGDVSATTLTHLGITHIWFGSRRQKEEDARFIELLSASQTVWCVSYNFKRLFSDEVFGNEFRGYFSDEGKSLRMLLADPAEHFYIENSRLELGIPEPVPPDVIASWQQDQANTINTIKNTIVTTPSQFEYRFYRDQMRLPITIFDNKVCILTIRVPGSRETVRIEFGPSESNFNMNIISHFNAVWSAAK